MRAPRISATVVIYVFVLSALSGLMPENVSAHARLLSNGKIPPRNNNAGLKTGPCGGVARTNTPTTLRAGETIEIQWEETIQHPGRYEFSFSAANDAGFTLLKTVNDTMDGRNDLPHRYTTTLTVPNTPCDACTLQMIQVMTENPQNPSYYYSCADIRIVSAGTSIPTPTPTPAGSDPAPTPATMESCDH